MPSDSDHPAAWDVYAEELFHLGFGHPLWTPDPERSEWEVEIADVGHLRHGEFFHLVRTRSPLGEEHQPDGLSPNGYAPFEPPRGSVRGPRQTIDQPLLYGRTIQSGEFSGGLAATVPGGGSTTVGGSIAFRCTQDKGALLAVPDASAQETFLNCKLHIVRYMHEHFNSWLLLANETRGIGLNEEEILFVSSVTKTSRWVVAAFSGSNQAQQGTFSVDLNGVISAGVQSATTKVSAQGILYKTGPHRISRVVAPKTGSSMPISSDEEYPDGPAQKTDQCIFFHYYKAKRRILLLPRRFKAAAGPHEVPRNPDKPDSGTENAGCSVTPELDFEMTSSVGMPYDPVTAVLDYILENSEAQMAIASDLDLYALFKDQEFPSNVAEQLAWLRPQVDVSEYGVGTLAVDIQDFQNDQSPAGEEYDRKVPIIRIAESELSLQDALRSPSEIVNQLKVRARRGPSSEPVPQLLYNRLVSNEQYIEFKTVDGGSITLADALIGHVDHLVGHKDPAFAQGQVFSDKISLRLQFPNSPPFHYCQVMVLGPTNSNDAITRGKLVRTIATEILRYLGKPQLTVDERLFPFEQVLLVRLRRVSKVSWQPELCALSKRLESLYRSTSAEVDETESVPFRATPTDNFPM